jgi:Clp amino terminal domain, pathogenicity island component
MFERFTDNARRSVVLAQEESRRLGHNYIGPEHVLLGILGAGPRPSRLHWPRSASTRRDPMRAVLAAVAASEYVLVLIGPSWLDSRTADGRRRIALDDDEVRVTLLAAQGPDHVIIPVLVHEAELPAADDLPTPVARLAELEPVRLRHLSFAAGVSRLLDRVRRDAAAA